MVNGNPMTVDIVIGDFKVSSSACLLGMPALKEHKCCIRCEQGIAFFIDDDQELQIFGKNRSTVVDLDSSIDSMLGSVPSPE